MPKLTIRSNPELPRKAEETPMMPAPRPCPRCRVMLQPERTYKATGLSGKTTVEYRFLCPACDARYHYSSRTGRWRELTEDPV